MALLTSINHFYLTYNATKFKTSAYESTHPIYDTISQDTRIHITENLYIERALISRAEFSRQAAILMMSFPAGIPWGLSPLLSGKQVRYDTVTAQLTKRVIIQRETQQMKLN